MATKVAKQRINWSGINWKKLWRGFVKSNYITALWNWFMGLAGKASEPVLFASVLYSGYQLVPGVPMPTAGINAIAFVTQQAALDVGGMGLIKLTKDEAPEKYRFARATGIALITLMVVNMIVATAGRVFPIPPQVMQITEGILLIIRSVMAVLFGHAIHTLKDDKQEEDSGQTVEQIVAQAVQSEAQKLSNFYQSKIAELEQALTTLESDFLASQERTPEPECVPPIVQENVQSEDVQPSTNPAAENAEKRAASEQKKVLPVDAKQRVQKLLKKQPNLTAKQIAEKVEISESYAQKLKAQIAKEATPKPQDTDPIPVQKPVTNGHRKVTQPLGDLVLLEV
jgi:hypothetical protein